MCAELQLKNKPKINMERKGALLSIYFHFSLIYVLIFSFHNPSKFSGFSLPSLISSQFAAMDSKEAAKVTMDFDTTVEIKIKTLDFQTYTLRVDKCVPVSALKEQIASVSGIPSGQQRLICRGRVLKDDQLLSAYHVEDGHALHLVVREPTGQMGLEGTSGPNSTTDRMGPSNTMDLRTIFTRILNSIGRTTSGNFETHDRQIISPRFRRSSSNTALSDSTNSQPNPTNSQNTEPNTDALDQYVIYDSLTTLFMYIDVIRHEFENEGYHANVSEGQESDITTEHGSIQPTASLADSPVDLPRPSSLAGILRSSRRLLLGQAAECLLQIATQLENHTSMTDPESRIEFERRASVSGVLLQNLGSFLLELGLATMALRMRQTPAEALVEVEPAYFISPSGPYLLIAGPTPQNMGYVTAEEPDQVDAGFGSRSFRIRMRTTRTPVAADDRAATPSSEIPVDVGANRTRESHNSANEGSNEQGVSLSNILRQILPQISQVVQQGSSSATESESENVNGSSSSRHQRDPPDDPSSKRIKRETE